MPLVCEDEMTITDTQPMAKCSVCGREQKTKPNKAGGLKVPRGWRNLPAGLACGDCAREAYYTRAFRVEIRGLAEGEDREYADFRKALSAASKASARYGNWLVQQLYAQDLAAGPRLEKTKDGKEKLPPCPSVDAYRPELFPELSGGCISGLSQMVKAWYSARRFDALVRLNRSVENYRFGYLPVEVRKQDWSLRQTEDDKLAVRCGITPGKSWLVKIYADGTNYSRLRAIQAGAAIALSLKVIRAGKRLADGRPVKSWFFRISAMFPRTAPRQSHQEITLMLGHDRGSLLFGSLEGSDEVFEFPGVALRKIIVGGDKSDKRFQQEQSMQRGLWSKRKSKRWGRDRTAMSESRQRKIKKQIELVASSLARWCLSHGVTSVDYETKDQGFICHFPWCALRDSIANALEPLNIGLHVLEATVQEEAL
jgi:hypothetical protein